MLARPVEAPGGVGVRSTQVQGAVVGIDLADNTVDVVNPSGGGVYTLHVTDPARIPMLASLKVGDTITAVVSQVVAVSIERHRRAGSSSQVTGRRGGRALRRIGVMTRARLNKRQLLATLALLVLAGCSNGSVGPDAVAGLTPDGTVDMREVQVAYIGSGGGGGGTLYYRGGAYPFSVGGLGVGGFGASTIDAYGEVYKLPSLAQFPGAYAQGRYGIVVGSASAGDLWLQNDAGAIMHLKAKRTGLMLSLGGDAVVISMK